MEQNETIKHQMENIMNELQSIKEYLAEKRSVQQIKNEWLDIQEVCQALKISKRTLQLYRQNGLLRGSKIVGKVYIKAKDIQKLLEEKHEKKSINRIHHVRR